MTLGHGITQGEGPGGDVGEMEIHAETGHRVVPGTGVGL